jgi:hypothetical protein
VIIFIDHEIALIILALPVRPDLYFFNIIIIIIIIILIILIIMVLIFQSIM